MGTGAEGLLIKGWGWLKQAFAFGKRYASLESRITAVEAALKKRPPDACPKCGERSMRLSKTWGVKGSSPNEYRIDDWQCGSCGHYEQRHVYFAKK
jgi:ribosomal protein L37AE/L43A